MSNYVGIQAPLNQCTIAVDRQLQVVNGSATVPKRLTALTITSIALVRSTGVATVVTTTAHWLNTGDTVVISGANETGYNSTSPWIITVTSTTAFTYKLDSTTALTTAVAATGTLVGYAEIWYHLATIYGLKDARTPNTGQVWLGPTSVNSIQPVLLDGDGTMISEQIYVAQAGTKRGLHNIYLDVATVADGVVVISN